MSVNKKILLNAIENDYVTMKKGRLPADIAMRLYVAFRILHSMGDKKVQRSIQHFMSVVKDEYPEIWEFIHKR